MPKILIAEDDASIRSVLNMALTDAGMDVVEVSNGKQAVVEHRRQGFDLLILDIGMPEMDGFETCKSIRSFSQVPVLFLTARDEEIDRVLGFHLGADDYVTKPFSPTELVLRIKAILARARGPQDAGPLRHGDLTLSASAHEVLLGEQPLDLTAMEFAVLAQLLSGPTRVFTRDQLITQLYGANTDVSDRTIDSHVRNLRAKAKRMGYDDIVRTIHGVGLRLGNCTA